MLSIENFRKRYDNFELDCTMSVEPGQITGIVGANGAGKSTLFKAILGLVKGDSGRITLFGKEPQQLTREDKEKIGVAFTNAGFNEYLRIKDIVPVLSNVYPSFEKEKFLGSCKKLNLSLDKKLKEFSTGMKAKLNVLIAVSHQAPFLILDEPTAGLDPNERIRFRNLISELSEDRLVLLSTHIVSDVEYVANEIILMKEGKFFYTGTSDEIILSMDMFVWNCIIPKSELNNYMKKYLIGNVRTVSDGVELRVLSKMPPTGNAVQVEATLEDAFLLYFGEKAGDKDDVQI